MDEMWTVEAKLLMKKFLEWTEKTNVYVGEGPNATMLKQLIQMAERLSREE
jgi:hypothetical protein